MASSSTSTTSHGAINGSATVTSTKLSAPTQASPPIKTPGRRRRAAQAEDDDPSKRRCVSTACIACRKRKSKCDGNTPACAACSQVYNTECVYDPNSDHRRKGVYKNEADSLKTKDTTLQTLIQAILNYTEEDVPELIQQIRTCDSLDDVAERILAKENGEELDEDMAVEPVARDAMPRFEANLYGKMGDLRVDEGAMRYIGGTSNLIHIDEQEDILSATEEHLRPDDGASSWTTVTDDIDLINHLLRMYFTWHYTYFTTLSKSLFYQDFNLGKPVVEPKGISYCSPILVNAMLALGCHFTAHPDAREDPDDSATAGDHFFKEAKRLLMEDDVLEKPRLTTVQALALMSVREAGCGREAKGWVYSGMSFRMSQDMGLHLDSEQLADRSTSGNDERDIDARRITFWGCFLFDKCWSNYMGRLPQLPRSIITTPKFEVFPDEDASNWAPYTDSGATDTQAQPARTRAVALELSRLCEISNDLMQNFYNPTTMDKTKGKQAELKLLSNIHTRLESWRRELPKEFEPKEGGLSSVLVMHMFFQLLFIHLFRPFLKYTQSTSPLPSNVSPRKLCTHAAASISKLLRLYKRSYGLRQICNIAVYIVHSACTIHLLNLPEKNARRDIIHGVKHLEEIAESWLCARRSLGILSQVATKWAVQLPHEAETVLTRSDAKFGPYKRDAQSPNANDSRSITRTAAVASQTSPQSLSQVAVRQSSNQSAAFKTSFPNHLTSTLQSGMSISDSMSLPSPPFPGQARSDESTIAARLDASPSAMFGGIDQLLRDSHDWAYKDQAQYKAGFHNWQSASDGSAEWINRTSSIAGAAHGLGIGSTSARTDMDHDVFTATRSGPSASLATAQHLPFGSNNGTNHVRQSNADWSYPGTIHELDASNMYDSMMTYNEEEWYQ